MPRADRSAAIESLVAAYFRALAEGDADAWLALHAAGASSFDPVDLPPAEGHAQLRRRFERWRGALAGFEVTRRELFVARDGAAVSWTGFALAWDGTTIRYEGIDVFELDDDDLIRTTWGYWAPPPPA